LAFDDKYADYEPEPAHDAGGGRLLATVTDPDGNVPDWSEHNGRKDV